MVNNIVFQKTKLKYLADLYNGNSIPDDKKEYYSNKKIPYIPTKAINVSDSKVDYNNGLSVNLEDGFKIANQGSILLCIEGGSAGKKICIIDRDVAFVNKLCCLKPINVYARYLFYALQSEDFVSSFRLHLSGMIGGVSINDLKNIVIYSYDLIYENSIANFLDGKCSKIDEVSKKIKNEIESLKKYKEMLITESVTKGLDRNVEMIDSNVHWIGLMPKKWNSTKLLYCLRKSISDGPHETPFLIDDGIPFISVDSLNESKNIDFSSVKKYISEEDYKRFNIKANIEKGDILFSKAATIGKTAIVGNEKFMVWSPLAILKSNEEIIYNSYLYYLLNVPCLIEQIRLSGSYNTQANVGMREMERAIIPVPSLKEQSSIVSFLDDKCEVIDKIIDNKSEELKLLEKYKKSLIYEYITGKKRIY